jgi:mitochondrial fission protein ELM1
MKTLHSRHPGYRLSPEKIVLGPKHNSSASHKTPVRIYVGTETAQARAERIFVWSIDLVRDPSRTYEIYLMKELIGFDRRRWLTGFTNYRFAIPDFAGGSGRAIYNDVDQIYLTDPAELFDLDLKDHGFLSIASNDSSVMIMDCKKMAAAWTLKAAQQERKNALLQKALAINNLWGRLDHEWNARDEEYQTGKSKVLHYTALHTQPWHPFPEKFVYQNSLEGDVWADLEKSANRAGYHIFSRTQPSSQFTELAHQAATKLIASKDLPAPSQQEDGLKNLAEYVTTLQARTLLYYHVGSSQDAFQNREWMYARSSAITTTPFDVFKQDPDSLPSQQFDIVYSAGVLEHLPLEDIPWVIEEMFRLTNFLVYVHIQDSDPAHSFSAGESHYAQKRDFHWWTRHFQTTSARHPSIHWKLVFQKENAGVTNHQLIRCGGHWIGSPPLVWILSDEKVGHTTQSEGLAKSLGWPYEIKHLHFYRWNKVQKFLWGLFPPNCIGLNTLQSSPLCPPWPDIVISTGWRPCPIARWIRHQSHKQTRIVQLGRKGGCSADLFDVVVTPTYYGFPPHPNRIETITPLHQVTQEKLDEFIQRWPNLFDNTSHPRIVLVIGGSTNRFQLTSTLARSIGNQVKDLAEKCQGTVFAVTSPRTGKEVVQTLESILSPEHFVHQWRPNQPDNPYLAYIAGADVIIITGESESMLAEVSSLGKPVYIIPLPERPPTWNVRLNQWIVQRAHSRPVNKRGTLRPQQGMERFCARLIRKGIFQPRRDLNVLHQILIQKGIARLFGEPIENGRRPRLNETEAVAQKVKETLGIYDPIKGIKS